MDTNDKITALMENCNTLFENHNLAYFLILVDDNSIRANEMEEVVDMLLQVRTNLASSKIAIAFQIVMQQHPDVYHNLLQLHKDNFKPDFLRDMAMERNLDKLWPPEINKKPKPEAETELGLPWIWVARESCGCVVAASVDDQDNGDLKDDLYRWLKAGLLVTHESGMVTLGACEKHLKEGEQPL